MMLKISVVILSTAGVLGTLIPVLPGTPLIVLAGLIYVLFAGLEALGWPILISLLVMSLAAEGSEYLFTVLGTKYFGGSKPGLIGAGLGLIIGLFTLGPLGLVLGPFGGAILAEILGGRPPAQAAKAGVGAILGQLSGSVVAFLISLIMTIRLLIAII